MNCRANPIQSSSSHRKGEGFLFETEITKTGAQSYLCGSPASPCWAYQSLPFVIQTPQQHRREFKLYPSTGFWPKGYHDEYISRAEARLHGALSTFLSHPSWSPGEEGLLTHPWRCCQMSNPLKALDSMPTPLPTPLSGRICSSSQQPQCFLHTSITALSGVNESVLHPGLLQWEIWSNGLCF